jgi:hypothetical protein
MINYNVIVRALTEWTGTNQQGIMDQTSINEGIGGYTTGFTNTNGIPCVVNTRQNFIQGIGQAGITGTESAINFASAGKVPNAVSNVSSPGSSNVCTRRYQINFALGLFTQDKLIPTKFMASQLAIEITLENPTSCIIAQSGGATGSEPTYVLTNVNLIPEILEFDAR